MSRPHYIRANRVLHQIMVADTDKAPIDQKAVHALAKSVGQWSLEEQYKFMLELDAYYDDALSIVTRRIINVHVESFGKARYFIEDMTQLTEAMPKYNLAEALDTCAVMSSLAAEDVMIALIHHVANVPESRDVAMKELDTALLRPDVSEEVRGRIREYLEKLELV